jgi:hypothetical protein
VSLTLRVKASGSTNCYPGTKLAFVLSETPQLTEVQKLFRDLDSFVGADSTCSN